MLTDVIYRADIGMIQRRGSLCFPLKTRQSLAVARYFVGQEFQRDKAMEARVLCFIDHAHSAAAKLLDNTVVADRLADHWIGARCYVEERAKSMNGTS